LTVWPAHHEGGSTFETCGAAGCALANAQASTTAANAAKSFVAGSPTLNII
jgi:hypothetical protein